MAELNGGATGADVRRQPGADDSYFSDVLSAPAPAISFEAFDAFKKTVRRPRVCLTHVLAHAARTCVQQATYKERSEYGGIYTVLVVLAVCALVWHELREYLYGEAGYEFSVDHGIGHALQVCL